jgi:hypothetical protein
MYFNHVGSGIRDVTENDAFNRSIEGPKQSAFAPP